MAVRMTAKSLLSPLLGPKTKKWRDVAPGAPQSMLGQSFLGGSYPTAWKQPTTPAVGGPIRPGGAATAASAPGSAYEEMRDSLFQEQMGMVSGDFGRRGVLSSSMYGSAAVTAADTSMRSARLMQWQREEAAAQRTHQMSMLQEQIAAQREAQELADMQQFRQWYGSMSTQDAWRALDALLG